MIEDVLVHVDGTPAGERRVAYAFDLAERHGARLTGLHVTAPVDVPPYFKPSMVDQAVAALERHAVQDAHVSEMSFESIAAKRSAPNVWRALDGTMADQICHLARSSDLVVLGQYEWEGSAERHPLSLAQAVALECGRPIIVVPAVIGNERMARALLAWDGSREAVRALHDAMPLLRGAKTLLEIATIGDGDSPSLLPDLLEHLKRHKITVEGEVHLPAIGSKASVLMQRLNQGNFDLLIMGAYGHPAWLEFLFSGTTPSALMNSSVPVLVSH